MSDQHYQPPLRILTPLGRRRVRPDGGLRRGVYLLPSMFTMANMFCGYACIVHAMNGDYGTAAPFIGVAIVLDMLDGRIARMTGSTSAFGVEFDSLADIVSFGIAPAVLSFGWGLQALGRLGWAVTFLFVAAAAVRLARFNIQSGTQDKRFFVGMPSPPAAGVVASTVFAYPAGFAGPLAPLWKLALVGLLVVPAVLMVTTIRFRSFKTFDLQTRRSYPVLLLVALGLALLAAEPQLSLVVLAYTYLSSAFLEMIWTRLRRGRPATAGGAQPDATDEAKHGTRG